VDVLVGPCLGSRDKKSNQNLIDLEAESSVEDLTDENDIIEETNALVMPAEPDMRLWYVVQTKPANEDRVKGNLLNQEIEPFLPFLGTRQYSNGKVIDRIKPLFPNYLFARMDLGLHYYKVKYTRGVSKILGNGEGPIPISEKVIITIRERMGEDNLVKLEDELKDGDVVEVTSGPFKDLRGVFQKKMSGKGRVKILLSLIGVDVPVQISRWQVKKVA
jgi:transcriptional antiterminator RfaH